jgi:hypothetical protein
VEPPQLPRSVEDLDEWSVYADHLLTIGDPRGEGLASELALPAEPMPDQIAEFQARAHRPSTPHAYVAVTWCLDHVRTLELRSARSERLTRQLRLVGPPNGALAQATSLLRSPALSRLEELVIPVPGIIDHYYRRMFAAVPATCERATVWFGEPTPALVDDVFGMLPANVRELTLLGSSNYVATRALAGRFDVVTFPAARIEDRELWSVLDGAPNVTLRLHRARAQLHPRVILGEPGDAGLLDREGNGRVLQRPSLLRLQERFGVVPARAQVTRSLPEHYQVSGDGLPALQLARRGTAWTVRSLTDFAVDGVEVAANDIVPLPDGAEISSDRGPTRFLSHDLDARYRADIARYASAPAK